MMNFNIVRRLKSDDKRKGLFLDEFQIFEVVLLTRVWVGIK